MSIAGGASQSTAWDFVPSARTDRLVGDEERLTTGGTMGAGGSKVNARGGGYKVGYEFLRYGTPSLLTPNSELEAELSTGDEVK